MGATSLDREAETSAPVLDQVALSDAGVRKSVATNIVVIFVIANLFTMFALAVVFWVDYSLLTQRVIQANERVITSKVVISLLGATTIQLGAVMMLIGKNLFPAPEKPSLWQRIRGK